MVLSRKPPCRHRVSAHIRDSHHIQPYMRGHGGKALNPYVRRTVISGDEEDEKGVWCDQIGAYRVAHCEKCSEHEPRQYRVTFRYQDGASELVKTVAHSPDEAFDRAQVLRSRDERATEVIIKNSLGDVVGRIARGTKKLVKTIRPYAKKSFELTKKGLETTVKTARQVRSGVQRALDAYANMKDVKLNSMLRRAYSSNLVVRSKARAQLRQEYPAVYAELREDIPPPTRSEITIIQKRADEGDIPSKQYIEEAKQLAKVASGAK